MNPSKSSKSVEETRQALIEAGRKVFAEDGFDGARVDRIAERAGVNKALINYHFGGKTELFRAIIEDFTMTLATSLREAIKPEQSAETQLRCYVRHIGQMVARNPGLPRLMLFESLRVVPSMSAPPMHFLMVLQTLNTILEKGQREGVFKPANLFFTHIHMISSFAMYHITRPIREKMREHAPIPDEVFSTEAFNAFVEDQVIGGLTMNPETEANLESD